MVRSFTTKLMFPVGSPFPLRVSQYLDHAPFLHHREMGSSWFVLGRLVVGPRLVR